MVCGSTKFGLGAEIQSPTGLFILFPIVSTMRGNNKDFHISAHWHWASRGISAIAELAVVRARCARGVRDLDLDTDPCTTSTWRMTGI